ncbi:MAG: DUF1667 domain-containing protein [Tissierellia bacterium]|nr:DUF1667 domain-containing protein [Tissierellia bacterium]
MKELICIACPIGCHLEIYEDENEESGLRVENAICKRGVKYGIKELTDPRRLLTSTVRINSEITSRLPVRTDKEIPKEEIFNCMKLINAIELKAPIKCGEILAKNILGTDVNIIASKSIDR